MEVIAFSILSTIVLISALCVILARNPVHSVLFLILAFFTSSGLLVLIGAEFLAMLLIVVYVGAVAVLFLFVVMMLDIDFAELKKQFLDYAPFGALVAFVFLAEIAIVAGTMGMERSASFDASPNAETNVEAIGQVMYTDYLLLFQISGVVLLIAMIGAIVLTLRHRPGVKRQSVEKQTGRTREEAIELKDVRPGQGI
ncbi:NADH-quinone oxidoreductase subunit J [Ponticaulis sp.]|uniref:NADH-quinone oxidoreductase subunit J n=1 Tax=Ponticaulis sp. TaxID=2020902 RepID=UPI000B646C35|nr:NADH-quinone oxidoreductase subunit J [Ponticaulis sp.]MAI89459.1 NADH:ubiquinone oxidoreductase subunit J [Ponticaulis sp.]OUY00496.1 MAG: NADH:ubiquinone oxidoreductase subunit J [Hyphomonadaceae bacterium TMED5]